MEDDKEIRDGVEIYLKNQGYQVWKAANGKEGLEIVTREEIHLAILDIMMPVMDGVTMLMKLREQNHEFPVIMLSAKSEEVDKIMGLNMGADDYVTKPFTPLELLARVNSHLRRYSKYLTAVSGEEQEKSHVYTIGGLELNEETVEVTVDGEAVKLTPMEFKIVQLLIKNPGRVFSADEIYERIWNEKAVNTDTIMVHVRNIREKMFISSLTPSFCFLPLQCLYFPAFMPLEKVACVVHHFSFLLPLYHGGALCLSMCAALLFWRLVLPCGLLFTLKSN